MTLHTYPDLVQGTDEWLEARRGIVTASVVGQLLTSTLRVADNDTSRSLTLTLVAERITGWIEPTYVNADMLRGTLDEPIARDLYAKHHAPVTDMGFMVREGSGWRIGYSPDGLVGDEGLIEIKSRRPKAQVATILADEVPAANMAQLQAALLVSDREWIDYVSFAGGLPLYVKRVYPDPEWTRALIAAAYDFEQAASRMVSAFALATRGLPPTERIDHDLEMVI